MDVKGKTVQRIENKILWTCRKTGRK